MSWGLRRLRLRLCLRSATATLRCLCPLALALALAAAPSARRCQCQCQCQRRHKHRHRRRHDGRGRRQPALPTAPLPCPPLPVRGSPVVPQLAAHWAPACIFRAQPNHSPTRKKNPAGSQRVPSPRLPPALDWSAALKLLRPRTAEARPKPASAPPRFHAATQQHHSHDKLARNTKLSRRARLLHFRNHNHGLSLAPALLVALVQTAAQPRRRRRWQVVCAGSHSSRRPSASPTGCLRATSRL